MYDYRFSQQVALRYDLDALRRHQLLNLMTYLVHEDITNSTEQCQRDKLCQCANFVNVFATGTYKMTYNVKFQVCK